MTRAVVFASFVFLGMVPALMSGRARAASSPVFAESSGGEWLMPPIVAEGSPMEALGVDPVLPVREGAMGPMGTGSLGGSFRSGQALPVNDRGGAGSQVQVSGLGTSAEETDVQAFGIPLNGAQGGGFDLASFPQFLWSGYRYQIGPGLGAFDPGAQSGTLTLVPWTVSALQSGSGDRWRLFESYSGLGQNQLAVGGRYGDRAAALVGWSEGVARGPSGVLSGRFGIGKVSGRYHLLATSLDVDSPGTAAFPTPRGRAFTARVIPVVQADVPLATDLVLKTSLFYDGTYLRLENPDTGFVSGTQVRHGGGEAALLYREWRLGAGLRSVSLDQAGQAPRGDVIGFGQLSRSIDLGASILLEPMVRIAGVTAQGILPQGSLGVRKELGSGWALFTRGSFTRRFASLVDRYYVETFFRGNPNLRPERTTTVSVGAELDGRDVSGTLEAYGQVRDDAQFSTGYATPFNAGQGQVAAALARGRVDLGADWETTAGVTASVSRLTATGGVFPGLPTWVGNLGVAWGRGRRLGADALLRAETSRKAAFTGQTLQGFAAFDLGARYEVYRSSAKADAHVLELSARVENLLDRRYEIVAGYPVPGRIISVALVGEL